MLAQRLRRWPNIKPTFAQCIELALYAIQRQTAVAAHLQSNHLLLFACVRYIHSLDPGVFVSPIA